MTCKQLGGACDLEFQANTFDEIAELSKKHGKEMFEKNDDPLSLFPNRRLDLLFKNK